MSYAEAFAEAMAGTSKLTRRMKRLVVLINVMQLAHCHFVAQSVALTQIW